MYSNQSNKNLLVIKDLNLFNTNQAQFYSPKFFCVIMQKRHMLRTFPIGKML